MTYLQEAGVEMARTESISLNRNQNWNGDVSSSAQLALDFLDWAEHSRR
ncbi:hypothetical protein [Paraburkholderia flagellata]|nr:hypothetical protein [Paraburkholderia flagellata]